MVERPDVSVLVVTYNHASFIAQTLDSILEQQGNIRFEVIVADDHSTDGTSEIVQAYQRDHSSIIRSLIRSRNLGFQRNYIDALNYCTGRYIATLDGDDYWLSSDKLRQQVALLDSNPHQNLCFGRCVEIPQDKFSPCSIHPLFAQTKLTLHDLLGWDFIPTCTAMFRRSSLQTVPVWIADLPMIDWAIWVIVARTGGITQIPEVLGAYRKHPGGVWTGKTTQQQIDADETFYRHMLSYLGPDYEGVIRRGLKRLSLRREQMCTLNRNQGGVDL